MMATREELASAATVASLKNLAEREGVDLGGATLKADIVAAIVASDVSDDELAALSPVNSTAGEEGNVAEEEAAPEEEAPAEEAPAEGSPVTQDPAIVDPDAAAAERVEGRTSDSALRVEGQVAGEQDPDLAVGDKPTDAEAY